MVAGDEIASEDSSSSSFALTIAIGSFAERLIYTAGDRQTYRSQTNVNDAEGERKKIIAKK